MSTLSLLRFIAAHPVNRDRPLAALARFARWQIGIRLLGRSVIHEWVGGARFIVRRGETGLTGNIYTGLHEFADMAFVLHFIRPDDWFFDVGANVGSYTLLACAAGGARGVAFEPLPQTYSRLLDNLRLNRLDDGVVAINCGVGAEDGRLRFSSGEDTMNHALAPGESSDHAVEVPVSSLDKLAGDRAPALIKIDVEGFETPVLQGAPLVLASPTLKAVIMELNGSGRRYGFDESVLLRWMAAAGFRTYSYDPSTRQLIDLGGKNLESGNTLFVRDEPFVASRLKSAAGFELFGKSF